MVLENLIYVVSSTVEREKGGNHFVTAYFIFSRAVRSDPLGNDRHRPDIYAANDPSVSSWGIKARYRGSFTTNYFAYYA